VNIHEPEMSLIAEIDQALHDNEHTDQPDWRLDGAVPPTVMSTEHGSITVHHDSCRYCLAHQAGIIGLGPALKAYLNTPAPPPPPRRTEDELNAMRAQYEAEQALIKSTHFTHEQYDLLDPTARAVFDVLYEHLDDDYELTPGVIADLITAVRLADAETSRSAEAPEQPAEAAPLPDVPLFTVEGETPHA
jgi:hypothetical protein